MSTNLLIVLTRTNKILVFDIDVDDQHNVKFTYHNHKFNFYNTMRRNNLLSSLKELTQNNTKSEFFETCEEDKYKYSFGKTITYTESQNKYIKFIGLYSNSDDDQEAFVNYASIVNYIHNHIKH
jgi:hypothetical protein